MAKDARSSKRKTRANALITTLAILGALLLVNIVFANVTARLDLSTAGFYSLTDGTKQLVSSLDEPINVTAYFGKVPEDHAFDQQYVEYLLDSYADASEGSLTWEKIDPYKRGSDFQKELRQDKQIDKIMWVSSVEGSLQQVPVYFHIHFQYLDKEQTWMPPGYFSREGLEHEFSSIIKRLAFPKKKIGVTSGFGAPQQARMIQAFLSADYEVRDIDLTGGAKPGAPASSGPPDLSELDGLIINGHSEQVSQEALMAIDKFVLDGKPTLWLMRGMRFQSSGNPNMPPQFQQNQPLVGMPNQSGLEQLLASYGVKVENDVILDTKYNSNGVVILGREGVFTNALFPNVEVMANGVNEPLAGLKMVSMPFACSMTIANDKVNGKVLTRSSDESFQRAQILPITREVRFERQSQDKRGPFNTSVALSGELASHFDNASKSPITTRLVVFGSAAFIEDQYMQLAQRHPLFQNLRLGRLVLIDLVDWLAGDQRLVAARTKEAPRPMERLEGSQQQIIRFGNSFGIALALLLIGVLSWAVRERRRRNISL